MLGTEIANPREWKGSVMKMSIRLVVVLALVVTSGSRAPAQTPSTGRLMREKLVHSQNVLEAIMTSNFASLESESAELAKATDAPAWSAFKSPEYQRQSAAFVRAALDLGDAAKARDLDAAALHYMSLTLSCFQCHRHMKNSRMAVNKAVPWDAAPSRRPVR
jgi:hypothetical protein